MTHSSPTRRSADLAGTEAHPAAASEQAREPHCPSRRREGRFVPYPNVRSHPEAAAKVSAPARLLPIAACLEQRREHRGRADADSRGGGGLPSAPLAAAAIGGSGFPGRLFLLLCFPGPPLIGR